MSRRPRRKLFACAAVGVALFSSKAADAQVVVVPGPVRPPMGLYHAVATGVEYDVANRDMALHHLEKLQGKIEGGAPVSDHHIRRIDNLRHRIAVEEWLIRKYSCMNPGYYPPPLCLDPESAAAIALASRPALPPGVPWPIQRPKTSSAARMSPYSMPTPTPDPIQVTIVNATEADVAYTIDGIDRRTTGGSSADLPVPPGSKITYDAGGSLGPRRYALSPGRYEFRSTEEGVALYKLPDNP